MPSPNAGSARPPESASSVAHSLATQRRAAARAAPDTLVPSLILLGAGRREREAEHRIGRGAADALRQPQRVEAVLLDRLGERAEPFAVERAEVAEPVADADLHRSSEPWPGRRCAYLPSSLRAIWRMCTSSGPSTRCSVRACAYIDASGQSSVTPAPPKSWMARSITSVATRAADHLDRRDLGLRRLLADRVHHPRGLQREEARLFDLHARLGDALADDTLVGERLAERDAHLRAHAHQVERTFGEADGAHAVVDAAGAEAGLRDREAAAFLAEQVLLRDAHVLPQRLAVAAALGVPEHGQPAHARSTPGASIGTRIIDCRWYGSASGSVTPMNTATLQRGSSAPLVNHLCPLMT